VGTWFVLVYPDQAPIRDVSKWAIVEKTA